MTGLINVPTSGDKVTGPSTIRASHFLVKAHPDNVGNVWVFSRTSVDGFPLEPGERVPLTGPFLNNWEFDSDEDDDNLIWLAINV